jgi:hypothetical protein
LLGLVMLVGCSTAPPPEQNVQRTTEGPTADELFMSRFAQGYGRVPTFNESMAFRNELEERVSNYLVTHPDVNASPRASQFTFQRRIAVGMTKEEVVVLGGLPYEATPDEKQMEQAAKQFWPSIKPRAKEMWIYPGGWQLYFDDERLVDVTVVGKPPL